MREAWTDALTFADIRFDEITFLSQCNARGIRTAFPGEIEQPSHGATQLSPPLLCAFFSLPYVLFFRVSIPPAVSVRPTLFTTDAYGIFNMRTHLSACRTHEGQVRCVERARGALGGEGGQAQDLAVSDRETVDHSVPSGDRTQGLWISDALSYVPRPPHIIS